MWKVSFEGNWVGGMDPGLDGTTVVSWALLGWCFPCPHGSHELQLGREWAAKLHHPVISGVFGEVAQPL